MKILTVPSSGSTGAVTASRNKGGQVRRSRRAPVQPVGTGRRAFIRQALATASTAWGHLTPAQRAAWNSYAATHPTTDSLGAKVTLTGHQQFIAVSVQLLNTQTPISNDPPPTSEVWLLTGLTFAMDHVTGINVNWNAGPGFNFILLAFTQQLAPGRTSWKSYTQLDVETDDSPPTGLPPSVYTAQFGTLQPGKLILLRATPVSQYGVTGPSQITHAIVT